MYTILVALCAVLLSILFWFDRQIDSVALSLWWIPIVVGYTWICLKGSISMASVKQRIAILIVTTLVLAYCITTFDDTLTIYLCGIVLFLMLLWGQYYIDKNRISKSPIKYSVAIVIGLIMMALIILPVPINRIVITTPDLSAGAYLSLHDSIEVEPRSDAMFLNRTDQYAKLVTNYGTQIYFTQAHKMPLFRIFPLRNGIVVRILSVRYDTRLAYLKIPLFELSGNALMGITAHGENSSAKLEMEDNKLLISQLNMQTPSFFQLPHMVGHNFSFSKHATVVGIRILIWLSIFFAIIVCRPTLSKSRLVPDE